MSKKHTVLWKSYGMYSSKELDELKDYAKENLEANDIEVTDYRVEQQVYDDIDMFYEDEMMNLNKKLDGRIIAIADLGLWYGRRQGYKVLGYNLNNVISFGMSCDEREVYCDAYNVRANGYHHDGSHHVLYRELREGRDIDKFLDKIYSGEKISSSTLNYYTKSLRPYIKDIYGID